jgi:NitT/TauT family transport system ATP-binding protein
VSCAGDGAGLPVAAKILLEGVAKEFMTSSGNAFVALKNVNVAVAPQEFVSLVGPSGCGKSTLLEIIAGLQNASAGRVVMDGHDIEGPGPDRAVVFQHFALFPWRTVIANVEFPMEIEKIGRRERRARGLEYLRMVGLEAFADRNVWQLSGGMQQRVALARAMACSPEVMLMDEPFSGADAITRELLQDQFAKLQRQTRKTVIFVTHSVDEAIHLSDRILVMGTRPGRIVEMFSVDDDLRRQPDRIAALRDAIWTLLRREIIPDSAGPDSQP